jgi:hypothetical protein
MWEIDLKSQIFSFLLSVIFGGAACLFYDVFCVLKPKTKKITDFFIDLIYFIILSFANFCLLLIASNGEIRLYLILGELLGFFVCKKTISRVFCFLIMVLKKMLKKIVSGLKSVLIRPVCDFFAKTSIICLKTSKKTSKFIKKGLKKHKGIVYTKEKCLNVGKGKEIADEH